MREKLLPICVDLDGTLIRNDVTWMATRKFICQNFFNCFRILFWLLKGRAYMKYMLSENVVLNLAELRYNLELLEYIKLKRQDGIKIFLATACSARYAEQIADFLKIFDGVFASSINVNLRAGKKANALVRMFGENGFVYAGNSYDDLKVWEKTNQCIVVAPTNNVLKKMKDRKNICFFK